MHLLISIFARPSLIHRRPACLLAAFLTALVMVVPVRSQPDIPRNQTDQELRVGFWDLRSAGNRSRVRDDIRRMAQVIHGLDCVALGQLRDRLLLSKLVNELSLLGGTWNKAQVKKRSGYRHATAEQYGFVYRSDKLEVRARARILEKRRLLLPGHSNWIPFEHPPGVCGFRTLDGRLDFTMVIAQITSGNDPALASYRTKPGSSVLQAAELQALVDYLSDVQREDSEDDDIILLGHLRRHPGDPALEPLLHESSMMEVLPPETSTSIDRPAAPDHIMVQPRFLSEYTGHAGVLAFESTHFDGDVKKARESCSDSRPIWIILRVPERDDD